MAVIETPPETVAAASEQATSTRAPAGGLAGVLGSGDHKVIGRLYIVTSLIFGLGVVVLGALVALEGVKPATLDVFEKDTVFQAFTMFRFGTLFLLAFPLVIGVSLAVVPLQVGAKAIAFPRAAAVSYWGWLIGSGLFIASYAVNGGPGGGRSSGVNLWITAMVLIVLSILIAAICLATTVLALRHSGLTLDRTPLFAWSVAVAAIMWILTLPVLAGLLVFMYVDHRHGGTSFGANAGIYTHFQWLFRNPQIYVLAIPVLGFAADVLATTAKTRIAPRSAVIGAIGAFGVFSFGAFLVAARPEFYESWVVIGLGLIAVLPVLAVLVLAIDLFRRGTIHMNGGAAYAIAALLVLLLGVLAGAFGSIPRYATIGTIYDIGISHAIVLASVIACIGAIHWWSTKIGRQQAKEGPAYLAALLLLAGAGALALGDLVSGVFGKGAEIAPDWTGGIKAANVLVLVGVGIVALGLLVAIIGLLPILRKGSDVPSDPWDGQTLEWLSSSPPPLQNFTEDLAVVTSAEPLVDLREEK